MERMNSLVINVFVYACLLQTSWGNDHITNFHGLFSRMPQLMLTEAPSHVIHNFTDIESCASMCVRQSVFDCRSFDVDNKHRTCKLYNTTHEKGRSFLVESTHTDHYRTAFETLFNRLPSHVLTIRHTRKIPDVSPGECARRCIFEQNFRCTGFDYEPGYANCWLTDLTVAESDGVKYHPGADFYERDFGGALFNFVTYGPGSLPYVNNRPIYSKTMFGLDLGACAQVCLSQTIFECASFDYSFGDQSCHMSRFVASDVGGIEKDIMPTYRVMHYEKKGRYLNRFHATPYSIVPGENDKTLSKVTAEMCAQACLEETSFVCRSFDYQIKDGSCMLSMKTGSDVGQLLNQGMVQVHHFEVKPSLDCGGVITDGIGDFASPGWPRNYSHHLNCSWTVRVPEHKVVMFTFIHFDLGKRADNPCLSGNDRLRITEMTPHGEVTLCAHPPMSTYISQTNLVTFNFLTNSHVDAQGFKVAFKGDWPCRAVLRSDRGEIASPQWPEQYSPGLTCAWTIQAPETGRVTLRFTNIDLDGQSFGACSDLHDFIDVFDGSSTSAPHLARFCKHESPVAILSTKNTLHLTFKTDGFVQRTGFHASYDFILPTTTRPPTTTSNKYLLNYGNEEVNDDVAALLSAIFVEPRYEREGSSKNYTREEINFGVDGGELLPPKQMDSKKNNSEKLSPTTYVTILWIVLVSLLLMTTVLSLVLVFICRHNRNRLEKKKALEKYANNQEENDSLYKDNYLEAADQFPPPSRFEEGLDTYRQLQTETDVAFSNPLYRGSRTTAPRRSEVTLVSEVLSDSGCSTTSSTGQDSTTQLITTPC